MQVALIGGAYSLPQARQSAQRCVNLYVEASEKGGMTGGMLVPRPGLRYLVNSGGQGPVRGMSVANGYIWRVAGPVIYASVPSFALAGERQVFAGGGTLLMSNGIDPVSMAANATQLLIVDGSGGYIVDLTDTTGNPTGQRITDDGFPAGVTCADYLDGYFIVAGDGTDRFWISALNDGLNWNTLDRGQASSEPDPIVAMRVFNRNVWLLGSRTTEVFQNTGNASFPLERLNNVVLSIGARAPLSAQVVDDSLIWLGQDNKGGLAVYRVQGYVPARISTNAIERVFADYRDPHKAVAWSFSSGGHHFYVLTFPAADASWAYDTSTGEWAEWVRGGSDGLVANRARRHPVSCHVQLDGRHFVGMYDAGEVYEMVDGLTEDGIGRGITFLRSTPPSADTDGGRLLFFTNFEVFVTGGDGDAPQTGPAQLPAQGVQLLLRYSNDGGRTWIDADARDVGASGEYGRRARWSRCGSARERVWEVSWLGSAGPGGKRAPAISLLGARVDVKKGAS